MVMKRTGRMSFEITANGFGLGEVGDLKAQSLKLLLMLIKTQMMNNPETPNLAKPMLYAVFSERFDKWEKEYNPSNSFIDGGRTIPYDFHYFCSNMWGEMKHQRGATFEMFREQMLNTAMNWQKSLKDSIWNVIDNYSPNCV